MNKEDHVVVSLALKAITEFSLLVTKHCNRGLHELSETRQ